MSPPNDETNPRSRGLPRKLVRLLQQKDPKSWRDLYEDHNGMIFGLIRRHFAHGCEDVACEIAQETWASAMDKFGDYKDGEPFIPWMMRIAGRSDSKRRYQDRQFATLAHDPPSLGDDEANLDVILATFVHALLSLLKKEPRKIIEWYYLEDLDIEEIAKRLEVSRDAAKRRFYRAFNRLQELSKPWRHQLPEFRPSRLPAPLPESDPSRSTLSLPASPRT